MAKILIRSTCGQSVLSSPPREETNILPHVHVRKLILESFYMCLMLWTVDTIESWLKQMTDFVVLAESNLLDILAPELWVAGTAEILGNTQHHSIVGATEGQSIGNVLCHEWVRHSVIPHQEREKEYLGYLEGLTCCNRCVSGSGCNA